LTLFNIHLTPDHEEEAMLQLLEKAKVKGKPLHLKSLTIGDFCNSTAEKECLLLQLLALNPDSQLEQLKMFKVLIKDKLDELLIYVNQERD
jgi:hypothetical protein